MGKPKNKAYLRTFLVCVREDMALELRFEDVLPTSRVALFPTSVSEKRGKEKTPPPLLSKTDMVAQSL